MEQKPPKFPSRLDIYKNTTPTLPITEVLENTDSVYIMFLEEKNIHLFNQNKFKNLEVLTLALLEDGDAIDKTITYDFANSPYLQYLWIYATDECEIKPYPLKNIEELQYLRDIELQDSYNEIPSFLETTTYYHLEIVELESTSWYYLQSIEGKWWQNMPNLKELSLKGQHIEKLPEDIKYLKKLENLNLEKNKLVRLPSTFMQLTNLKKLNLDMNNFSSLPSTFTQLTNLKELDLSSNNFSVIPNEITELQSLEELVIGRNQITTIPTSLFQLPHLNCIMLYHNRITTIPTEINQSRSLKHLWLSYNPISTLPETLYELENLEYLALNTTKLETISPSISKLKNLSTLDISENPQLKTFPFDAVANLKHLEKINLTNTGIPLEAIIDFEEAFPDIEVRY